MRKMIEEIKAQNIICFVQARQHHHHYIIKWKQNRTQPILRERRGWRCRNWDKKVALNLRERQTTQADNKVTSPTKTWPGFWDETKKGAKPWKNCMAWLHHKNWSRHAFGIWLARSLSLDYSLLNQLLCCVIRCLFSRDRGEGGRRGINKVWRQQPHQIHCQSPLLSITTTDSSPNIPICNSLPRKRLPHGACTWLFHFYQVESDRERERGRRQVNHATG